MEQYSQREYIKIAGIPLSITNNLLEQHVLLMFSKICVNIDELDIVACHRLGSTDRIIVKFFKSEGCFEITGK